MTDCAAPRHAEEPVNAEPHAFLCGPCRRGLSRDLRRLPALHADLDVVLVLGAVTGSGFIANASKARGAGSPDDDGETQHVLHVTALPFNDAASECRLQIRHDLTYWTREITRERGLDAPPPLADDDWAHHPVAAMAGWLHGQVTWCTFRGWAGDMAGAISEDAGRARSLLDPWVTKRFELPGADGLCLACRDAGTDPPGRMEATIYASDGDRRRPVLTCGVCGESLAPEQWLRYGEKVIARRESVAG